MSERSWVAPAASGARHSVGPAASGARHSVALTSAGLALSSGVVPLYSAAVHYWRLERESWPAVLGATKELGVRIIDTYVPWGVHETEPGQADFGRKNPRLDVVAFLRLAQKLGLFAIVRPGPHINAELTFFGLPERIVWDRDCQARSPGGNPVVLPMVPLGFPVPSYASDVFLRETERWYRLVGAELAPLVYPKGPIVLSQIDNEAAFYFRDGVYDQDYRPEALAQYRAFVERRYETEEALARAYGRRAAPFAELNPPVTFAAGTADELAYHLDWTEFQEHLVATSLGRMRAALERAGLSGIPTFHNMTMGHEATPLSASRIGEVVDFVGLDYYHRASPVERVLIQRRTTELVTRCEGMGQPSFACEMGAGFPPHFFPIPDEDDNAFTVLTALAYGLRGFNIYMAVDRDRWIGAPITRRGVLRPSAEFWRKLIAGLEEVRFHELVRKAPVRIVVPALKRRLCRALHAFSPATPAFFALLGAGSRESCFEEDFGLGGAIASQMDAFISAFEESLTARGVPFAHVDGDAKDVAFGDAGWILCPTAGGVEPRLWEALRRAAKAGAAVTVGPHVPTRGGALGPLTGPLDASPFEVLRGGPAHPFFDRATIDPCVDRAIEKLELPVLPVQPSSVHVTVHEDRAGHPRVLFVINAGEKTEQASIGLGSGGTVTDLLQRSRHDASGGRVELTVRPRSVRMFRIGGGD
jgi:beta-galactosidase